MSITSNGFGQDTASAREFYSLREVETITGFSHATVYRLIGQGRLDARKIGTKTIITSASLRKLIDELPAAQVGNQGKRAAV
jgi:hypothetical protein